LPGYRCGDDPEGGADRLFSSPLCSRCWHCLFQFFLVISKQSVNLAVRFVADSVNLRSKLLPGRCWILVEKRLNPVMVLHKQGPDLPLLFPIQLQIFRKTGEFLLD
jgi:hypothetical protein